MTLMIKTPHSFDNENKEHFSKPLLVSEKQALNVIEAFNNEAKCKGYELDYHKGHGFIVLSGGMDFVQEQANEFLSRADDIAKEIVRDNYVDTNPNSPTQFTLGQCRIGTP